jgi:hypothetical protein
MKEKITSKQNTGTRKTPTTWENIQANIKDQTWVPLPLIF